MKLIVAHVCVLVLLTGCAPDSPSALAEWTCNEILQDGRDPDEVIDAMEDQRADSGFGEAEMFAALQRECGVELGLTP